MLRIMVENAFTDEITSSPEWQRLNSVCREYGYSLDDYARVEVSADGKETLEDIRVYTDDEELPVIDSDINGKKVTFSVWHKGGIDDKTPDEYAEYVKKLDGVVKLLEELNSFDFTKLYKYIEK